MYAIYPKIVLWMWWFSSHASHLDTVIKYKLFLLGVRLLESRCVLFVLPSTIPLVTTIWYRMVLDSKYHRIYGTMESLVPAQLWFKTKRHTRTAFGVDTRFRNSVLCCFYLATCVRVCHLFYDPLRECLWARCFRASLLLHLHLCACLR